MSFSLTKNALELARGIKQSPQLVLEIDGAPNIYGIGTIKKYIRIGDPDLYIGNDWVIGGMNELEDQVDLISLDGTTKTITQQLLQDKGGTSSASSIQISLIDLNNQITELITPGEVLDDILGRKATVYLGYSETAFPQDFIVIFTGIVDEIIAGGSIVLNIAHPDSKKRSQVFQQRKTVLTSDADFKSKLIQDIKYKTRRGVAGIVSVEYTNTGTAGSEVVTVVGNAISVAIQSGVSTAAQIRRAIESKPEATALISIEIVEGESGSVQTTNALTNLDTSSVLNVQSTAGFLVPPADTSFKSYVRINDEVIRYTGMTTTSFTGCTREAFVLTSPKSRGDQHSVGDDVTSFYRLEGNAIDLALKIMMSGPTEYFAENVSIGSFIDVENVGDVENAVYFQGINVSDRYGIVSGDFITITGDTYGANNVTDAEISSVVVTEFGSYIVLSGVTLVENGITSAVAKFKSQYNVFPDGLDMGGDQVDVPEFLRIQETFGSSIFDYDYYLTEDVTAKEFIDEKLLFPTGAFSLPRKGKISVGYSSPPLLLSDVVKLDSSNTTYPDRNKISRSINKNFYNNLLFRYNNDVVDNEKFLSGDLTVSADSKNRIQNAGNKVFKIDAEGLRPSGDTDLIISILRNRILDRYKYGAEKITVGAFYGEAFTVDVGDVVIYGGSDLKLPDTKAASRDFEPRLFEVVNKSLDIQSGIVKLDLVDTQYSAEGSRFGVFSPASIVGSGSTTTQVVITDSFGTESPKIEKDKWLPYIGQNILVRNDNCTNYEEVTLTGFLSGNNYTMVVSPALTFAPSSGDFVEIANYPTDTNSSTAALYKNAFCFSDPQVAITGGSSGTVFTVGAGDVSKMFVGSFVIVHNDDWSSYSLETKISDITGTTITVEDDLGFTPTSSFFVDLIGFPDEGYSYRYL